MLKGLGRDEVESILVERGEVEIGCDFCGLHYHFDRIDAAGLFRPERAQPPPTGSVH